MVALKTIKPCLVVPQLEVGVRIASELVGGGGVAPHAGVVEGGQAVLVLHVQLRSVLDQQSNGGVHIVLPICCSLSLGQLEPRSEVEGSEAVLGGDVDLGTPGHQQGEQLQTVLSGSVMQGRHLQHSGVMGGSHPSIFNIHNTYLFIPSALAHMRTYI